MEPTEDNCSATRRSAESSRGVARSARAAFELGSKSCVVVPAAEVRSSSLQGDQKRGGIPPVPVGEVVGECVIENVEYIVLCCAEPPEEQAPPVARVTVADLLTRRELQVALLVADGRITKQIADQLRVSQWTVSSHLRRIYAKLGVRTRAAMVARVLGDVCSGDGATAPMGD